MTTALAYIASGNLKKRSNRQCDALLLKYR